MFIQGLSTMLSVDTAQGQLMYGPKYKDHNYFVTKHAYAANFPFVRDGADPNKVDIVS